SLDDSLGFNYVWSTYGMMYGMQSMYDSSIHFFEAAIGVAERNGYEQELSGDYMNIAISYQMQSNFPEALRYQQKAFTLAKARNNIEDQAYTSLNMGLIYFTMGDSSRAEKEYIESVNYAKKVGENAVELYAYSNLSELYLSKKQPQKAYDYAMKAAMLGRQMGDQGIEAASLSKASRSLIDLKRFDEAETLARQGMAVADSSGQPLNIFQAYSAMGTLLKSQENYKQAIPYFEKGLAALQHSDIYDEAVGQARHNLSECYEKTNDYRTALLNYKTGSQILDSVRSRENVRKATELTMNYEYEKRQEAQRIEQKQKDARSKERQIALMIGLGLTLILTIVAFTAYRNKHKANNVLRLQKLEIERTLNRLEATQKQLIQSEKMASLGELTAGIAHEIQNPLNFVNNFSEVSTELLDEMKQVIGKGDIEEIKSIADDVKQNLEKILHHGKRADGIVKGMLQHSRVSSGQKEPSDINALADEYLRLAYHGLRAKDKSFNATMKTDFDTNTGLVKIAPQDIGRVILNLLTNAFYAVNEKKKSTFTERQEINYEPTVFVGTKKEKDMVEITIRDNGNGIPEKIRDKIFQPFFTTKPTGQGTGLGLSLSYDIVTNGHGGELKMDTKQGVGTTFTISIPANV
ncbi:MAG TPA: tetratricopeptide repeat protein, partial [Chitinophagaceae bacterium]|nr:tetratricopeptide repeat protein [Chitinophagaceae bacterium]